MARNRKRAKERRGRRPQPVAARSRATGPNGGDAAPSPLEHAAPDVELADAQLAVGRPDVVTEGEAGGDGVGVEDPAALSADQYAAGGASTESEELAPAAASGRAGAVAAPGAEKHKESLPSRLTGFLQGSWRELQRVQWPDRRQVIQATAVVIGFVIVAGVFLGVADTAASHLMDYILTGKTSVWAWVAVAVVVLSAVGWSLTDRDK
ncbi:MAG: preprotein translocase subunit SecE [Solirubrobacteraceae bacterium]